MLHESLRNNDMIKFLKLSLAKSYQINLGVQLQSQRELPISSGGADVERSASY